MNMNDSERLQFTKNDSKQMMLRIIRNLIRHLET